jgi:hypothetical protein
LARVCLGFVVSRQRLRARVYVVVRAAYMYCSPTRRALLSGRLPLHINVNQAPTCSNYLPLQLTLLSEKLKRAPVKYSSAPRETCVKVASRITLLYYSFNACAVTMYVCVQPFSLLWRMALAAAHFIGKGHLGFQTTNHLPIHRGFDTHLGFLQGDQNYVSVETDCLHAHGMLALTPPRALLLCVGARAAGDVRRAESRQPAGRLVDGALASTEPNRRVQPRLLATERHGAGGRARCAALLYSNVRCRSRPPNRSKGETRDTKLRLSFSEL